MDNELLTAIRNKKISRLSDEQILQDLSGSYPEEEITQYLQKLRYMQVGNDDESAELQTAPAQEQPSLNIPKRKLDRLLDNILTGMGLPEARAYSTRNILKSICLMVVIFVVMLAVQRLYEILLWILDVYLTTFGLEIPGVGQGFSKALTGYVEIPVSLLTGITIHHLFKRNMSKWMFMVVITWLTLSAFIGVLGGLGVFHKLALKGQQAYNTRALEQVHKKQDSLRAEFNKQGQFYTITVPDGYTLENRRYDTEYGNLTASFDNQQTGSSLVIRQSNRVADENFKLTDPDQSYSSYTTKNGLKFYELKSGSSSALSLISEDRTLSISLKPIGADITEVRYIAEGLKLVDAKEIALYDIMCSDEDGNLNWNGSKRTVCETTEF